MSNFNDTYQILNLTEKDAEKTEKFLMEHFLLEEPLNRASGMTPKNFQCFVDKLIQRTLNIPFSYAVVDKESQKFVACAMSSYWKNENNHQKSPEAHPEEFQFEEGQNQAIGAIGKILTDLHAKFYQLKPEIPAVLHLEILSVAKSHQRRGLASKLMGIMEDSEKMNNHGAIGIASEISSLANQCLMKKRGYTTLTETLLSSECDASGKPLIITDDGTDRVTLVYKKF